MNGNIIDLTGQKFGLLKVLSVSHSNDGVFWNCVCDCGKTAVSKGAHLRFGQAKSCGCTKFKHAMSKTRLYKIWAGIKKRCYQINCKSFPDYGGRGIKMCEEWRNDFLPFHDWATKNGYKYQLTIERINHDGHYSPENCSWISKGEQNLNTRKSRMLTFNGKTQNLILWARETGIGHATILYRLKLGWPVDKALTLPAIVGRNQWN